MLSMVTNKAMTHIKEIRNHIYQVSIRLEVLKIIICSLI